MRKQRDFFARGSGIVALVFSILGLAFLPVGAVFAFISSANDATDQSTSVEDPRWIVGVTFLIIGAGFAAVGVTLGWRRIARPASKRARARLIRVNYRVA